MSEVVCDPTDVRRHPDSLYARGEVVVIIANRDTQGLPADKKLWIRDKKIDWSHKSWRKDWVDEENWWYLLKDGPGENAKEVGWVSEENISEWSPPKKEESLIDLDPGYPVKDEEPLIDLD